MSFGMITGKGVIKISIGFFLHTSTAAVGCKHNSAGYVHAKFTIKVPNKINVMETKKVNNKYDALRGV